MKILAIETSCDETAIALLQATPLSSEENISTRFEVLGNALLSQIDIHKEYGGVFPALAKREHAKNLVPVLSSTLAEAGAVSPATTPLADETRESLRVLLEREPGLGDAFISYIESISIPDIDAIAVTHGPGLEPALWVGVNFAKALALVWDKPLIAVNHMEGHMLAGFARMTDEYLEIDEVKLPAAGLLISGGHTEIVVMEPWLSYRLMGATKDDAVGEAFDKVARMLDLPYPGGPEISKLAEAAREADETSAFTFPRPMISDNTCDFSFSGLKTSILYKLKEITNISEEDMRGVALEFEDAVADVLWKKTSRALDESHAKTLVIGGGVSNSTHLRRVFGERMPLEHPEVELRIPERVLTTDNAVMIGIAGYYRALRKEFADPAILRADGNLSL